MPRISFLGMMAAAKVVPVRAYCTAAGRELMVIEPPRARKRSFVRRGLGFSLMGVGGLLISIYSTNIQAKAHRLNVHKSVKEEESAAKAEARAEKAEARAEKAEARAHRDEKRAERAEARAEMNETRAFLAEARADRDEKRADRAAARAELDEARADRAEKRAVEAAAAAQQGWFGWGKKKEKKEN